MATGTIMSAWKDDVHAHLAVALTRNGEAVEYIGKALLVVDGAARTNVQLRNACVQDIRDQIARKRPAPIVLPLSGEVEI
jgi:hypothetical protein